MNDTVLDIQSVKQNLSIDKVKTIGKKLKSMIIDRKEEKLPNGNIRLTLILDPKIRSNDNG